MRLEYRIHKKGEDYYPHTRSKSFLFWSSWKRIFKVDNSNYRLTIISDDSPMSRKECEELIDNYHKWFIECPIEGFIMYRPEY